MSDTSLSLWVCNLKKYSAKNLSTEIQKNSSNVIRYNDRHPPVVPPQMEPKDSEEESSEEERSPKTKKRRLVVHHKVGQLIRSEFKKDGQRYWLEGEILKVNPKTCVVKYSDGQTLSRTQFKEIYEL